jgi:hypothetical protein
MDPDRRELFADWERGMRLMVARFRADSARHLGDPGFEELIHALRQSSPEFCHEWIRHEVARSGAGRKQVRHPVAGTLIFEHATFNPLDAPEQRLALYMILPDAETPAKMASLLEGAFDAATHAA